MKRWLLLFVSLILAQHALAAPELKGSADELADYLQGVVKTVTLSAQAKQALSLDKAVITLVVGTEANLLSDALKENLSIRQQLRSTLEASGIPKKHIRESRFSSTPEYGIFGDRPKSYNCLLYTSPSPRDRG